MLNTLQVEHRWRASLSAQLSDSPNTFRDHYADEQRVAQFEEH